MIFVGGIHGVGKTSYCKRLAEEIGFSTVTASQLIKSRTLQDFQDKKVSTIIDNQKLLIEEVHSLKRQIGNFILDGHLCLVNKYGNVEKLPKEVFKELNINMLVILIESPKVIQKRLWKRNQLDWNIEFIEKFQNVEMQYAKELSKTLNIDMKIVIADDTSEGISNRFDKNIILPIKPIFADKILNSIKKYEFRKNICSENIDKIYIYATAPQKCIVGEVEVLERLMMQKENLWEITKEEAGISKEYYDKYFEKLPMACAYRLGNVIAYSQPISLNEIGITYTPQSYVYVGKL